MAYRVPSGGVVLHRITRRVGDRYEFQGDNNFWVDPYLPAQADIVGRLGGRVPKVGWVIDFARQPRGASLSVGVVSFLAAWRYQRRLGRRLAPAGAAALTVVAVAVLSGGLTGPVLAARSPVPATRLGVTTTAIRPDDWKPEACAGIAVQRLVTGSGTVRGSTEKDLILAGPGADVLRGVEEKDCLLGGGGSDTLNGGADQDVCLGGPGTDTFSSCETTIQ